MRVDLLEYWRLSDHGQTLVQQIQPEERMLKLKGLAGLIMALVITFATATPSQAQLFGRKNDDSSVRIGQLEERIRVLTGQIEQLSYQMR